MTIIDGTPDNDTLPGTVDADTISGFAGDDLLQGDSGDDSLDGGEGSDTLDGGLGFDTLVGGRGDDVYIVDRGGEFIVEEADEGWDTIISSVTRTLSANVERLVLTGSDDLDGRGNGLPNILTGNSGDNLLEGLAEKDTLYGGAGADTLDGGLSFDRMIGGEGDDSYYVDRDEDVVVERAGEGVDTVFSSVSWQLGADVENLTLTGLKAINGAGNGLDNTLTGNDKANVLRGRGGDDEIDGGHGRDRMIGGTGNDHYVVDHQGDRVEERAGGGDDDVEASISYRLGRNVEDLHLTGTAHLKGFGNRLANEITGNDGNNELFGFRGGDILNGEGGNNRLYGGRGHDQFVVDGDNGRTAIADFRDGVDKLVINGYGPALDTFDDLNVTFNGDHVVIDLGADVSGAGTVVLRNFQGTFDAADVLFG